MQAIARKLAEDLWHKDGDAGGLLDLPPVAAHEVLLPEMPRIVNTQKTSGLWRTNHARAIAFSLLKALKYAGLLEAVIPQLRVDPFPPFCDAEDWYGIAVRCQLLRAPRTDEQAVIERLLAALADRQCADGSWENTVVATVHHLEILLEVGLRSSTAFTRGIAFLFACMQPEVWNRRSAQAVAHDMISSPDGAGEYYSAVRYKPHWLPNAKCYTHLPMLQTYCALRLLNKAGYEDDPRVIQACRNLVAMYERFGGWCASNIHHGLAAEAKSNNERQSL